MTIFNFFTIAWFLLFGDHEIPNNLPINKIQVIGSHNSYKQAIDSTLFKLLATKNTTGMQSLEYSHIPIVEQLDMGLRNLEIDVYRDDEGGRFSNPKGLSMVPNQAAYDPKGDMLLPGFKVMHIPDIDFRTDAYTLKDLLQRLRSWSEQHPDHAPVFITLEAKGAVNNGKDITSSEDMDETGFAKLDSCLIGFLGREHIITPDDVRGRFETLEKAVLQGNWPTMQQARGKYLFLLDDKGAKRDMYINGHPSLKGRVMFANANPGTAEAACLIRNDAKLPEINSLVKKGYIVRTRADANTKEARANDWSNFEAACRSGAQVITTDYYLKSAYFDSAYEVSFENKQFIRLNPVLLDQKPNP